MDEPLPVVSISPIETVHVEASRLPPWWLLALLAVAGIVVLKRL